MGTTLLFNDLESWSSSCYFSEVIIWYLEPAISNNSFILSFFIRQAKVEKTLQFTTKKRETLKAQIHDEMLVDLLDVESVRTSWKNLAPKLWFEKRDWSPKVKQAPGKGPTLVRGPGAHRLLRGRGRAGVVRRNQQRVQRWLDAELVLKSNIRSMLFES